MGQSHKLLQEHFQEIEREDKENILRMFTRLDQTAWVWQLLSVMQQCQGGVAKDGRCVTPQLYLCPTH